MSSTTSASGHPGGDGGTAAAARRHVARPRRLERLLVGALVAVAAAAWTLADARARRARRREALPRIEATARLLGSADLALSSSSRWLRHPTLTEPGAPFADSPAILDADPAGAWIAAPEELFVSAPGRPVGDLMVRKKRSER